MSEKRLKLIALGGTIAMVPGAAGARPGLTGADLIAAVPGLDGLGTIEAETFRTVGSPALRFADLIALARRIDAEAESGQDGIVITQGTDTLEESAFALDLMLRPPCPVIVTGAMRNPMLASPDGAGNVLAAMRIAGDRRIAAAPADWGVLVASADQVFPAMDVQKAHAHRVDAFRSPGAGPLGAVLEDRVVLTRRPLRAYKAALGELLPAGDATPPVALIAIAMDDDGVQLRALLEAEDRRGQAGIVLSAFGGGHVPPWLMPEVRALAATLPLVVAGRPRAGALLAKTYEFEGAERDLAAGAISAGWLEPTKARVLLRLLLARGADRDAIAAAFRCFHD